MLVTGGDQQVQSVRQLVPAAPQGGAVGLCAVLECVGTEGARLQAVGSVMDLVWTRAIDPGPVFDLELPLSEVAEGYAAMDERRAIKTLLRP